MRKSVAAAVAVAMLVACGQRSGVHAQFVARFRTVISASTTAHGASAKTRHTPRQRHIDVRPEHIPGGRRILNVPEPSAGPDGTLVVTWPQWAALLLDRLGAPRCANNLIVVVAWAAQEGSRAGWNPLDTTLDMPGATLYNPVGVRNYQSLQQGLDATVLTLRKGLVVNGYGAIVQDLRLCADPLATAAAINASNWCRGCAGGAYVLGVIPRVIAAYVASLRSSS